jgi:hypothetical protein
MATMLWRGRVFLSLFVLGAKAQDMIPLAAAGMRQSFSEAFYATLPWCSKRCQGERWRTKYDHSVGTPLSRNLGMSGSEGETFMDPAYLGLGVNSFDIDPGTLSLLIGPVSERAKSTVLAAWPPWWGAKRLRHSLPLGCSAPRGAYAYAKYRSIDQKIVMPMREAEVLSNAAAILAIGRPGLPVGIANGALLPTRIVADNIGSVSYRASHAPGPLVSGLSEHKRNVRVKDAKELSLLPDVPRCALCVPSDRNSISRGVLVRDPVATATVSILSVRSQCYLERRERLPWRLLCRM